jgi:hypothetical protein
MASQDSVTRLSAPSLFSSSFGYWAEVPKGAILAPYWHRQNPLTAFSEGREERPNGLPDRRVR